MKKQRDAMELNPHSQVTPGGPFFGSGLSQLDGERLAAALIDRKLLAKERELFRMKWFDYRGLYPTTATYLFAEHYTRAYQWFVRRRDDYERGQYVKGFKGEDIFAGKKSEYTGMWKARQNADRLGIPYGFYTREAMNWADKNLWHRPPRPSQLYSAALTEALQLAWDELCGARIQAPEHVDYRAENYRGDYNQRAFQSWLCEQIKRRAQPHLALGQYLFTTPLLVLDVVREHFNEATIERARDIFCEYD